MTQNMLPRQQRTSEEESERLCTGQYKGNDQAVNQTDFVFHILKRRLNIYIYIFNAGLVMSEVHQFDANKSNLICANTFAHLKNAAKNPMLL